MSALGRTFEEYRDAVRRFSPAARQFLLATSLGWMAHGVVAVLLNLYLIEGRYRESFVGRVVASNALAMALAALPAGWMADRWGRRRVLVAGSIIEGLGMLARAATLHPGVLLVSSFVAGIGQSTYTVAAAPFITEHSTSRERTHLFSAFFSVELIAAVVGNMIGGWLPGLFLPFATGAGSHWLPGYRATLLVGGASALAAALPTALIRGVADARIVHARGGHAADERKLRPIAINAMLLGGGAGLVIPFMNLYFARRFSCSSAQIGVFFSAAQLVTAIAAAMGPVLAHRFGKLRTATAMELLSLPFLVTMGFERRLDLAVGAFLVRATLMQAGSPLISAFVMEALPPTLRARSTSLQNTLWQASWALSSSLAGLILQYGGYAVPFYITAVLYASAGLSFWWAFRHQPETHRERVPIAEALASAEGPAAD